MLAMRESKDSTYEEGVMPVRHQDMAKPGASDAPRRPAASAAE